MPKLPRILLTFSLKPEVFFQSPIAFGFHCSIPISSFWRSIQTDEASYTLRSWSVLCFKSCNSVSTVERRWFIRTSPTSKNTALIAKTPTTIKMVRVAERKVGGHLFLTSSLRLWSILCVTSQLSFGETTLKADKRESNSTLIAK